MSGQGAPRLARRNASWRTCYPTGQPFTAFDFCEPVKSARTSECTLSYTFFDLVLVGGRQEHFTNEVTLPLEAGRSCLQIAVALLQQIDYRAVFSARPSFSATVKALESVFTKRLELIARSFYPPVGCYSSKGYPWLHDAYKGTPGSLPQ